MGNVPQRAVRILPTCYTNSLWLPSKNQKSPSTNLEYVCSDHDCKFPHCLCHSVCSCAHNYFSTCIMNDALIQTDTYWVRVVYWQPWTRRLVCPCDITLWPPCPTLLQLEQDTNLIELFLQDKLVWFLQDLLS